jgi:hypothetical protein
MTHPTIAALARASQEALEAAGIAVFYSQQRKPTENSVGWDFARNEDSRGFIAVAVALGIKVACLAQSHFHSTVVERLIEEAREAGLDREARECERELKKLKHHLDEACALQLSFDYLDRTYTFEVMAEWYADYLNLAVALEAKLDALEEDDESEDDDDGPPPSSGYFRN